MEIVIIGNGITGITAALTIRELQPEWNITVISGESTYHYSRPALMYIFMGHMSYQDTKPYENGFWTEKKINLIRDWVTGIDTGNKRLGLHKSNLKNYDKLLIATGSVPNRSGWPGQELEGVQGFYDLMDLKKLYSNVEGAKRAVIVGGGLIGVELAEMLNSRNLDVTILEKESRYWGNILPAEESWMVERVIRKEGIDIRLETQLAEIHNDGSGRAGSVITDKGENIQCELVGLTAGVRPNIQLARDSGIDTNKGVLVNRGFKTNVKDIYSAGDCAEILTDDNSPNLIQQVWYTGKKQGECAGRIISGYDEQYEPGIWYNSAKFFDLEYQTYGSVNLGIPGEKNLYWEHSNSLHSLRIVYTDEQVIGINVMGLRYRHKVCEDWIKEKRDINLVLENLGDANFDPEFHASFETDILNKFRECID